VLAGDRYAPEKAGQPPGAGDGQRGGAPTCREGEATE
jgi:hypothetical protein